MSSVLMSRKNNVLTFRLGYTDCTICLGLTVNLVCGAGGQGAK